MTSEIGINEDSTDKVRKNHRIPNPMRREYGSSGGAIHFEAKLRKSPKAKRQDRNRKEEKTIGWKKE